jgi:hypothetical protein
MIFIIYSLDNKTLNPKLLPWMVYAKQCHCYSPKAAAAAATTHSCIHDQKWCKVSVRLANTQKTLKEIRKLSGQQGLFYLHLHDD